jgi:nitrogen regulatory protein P-II 1
MPELIVLVIDDPNKSDEILNAWLEAGISGATILESAGLGYFSGQFGARDDLPIFPSIASLLHNREEKSRTFLTVVPDGFDVERLVAATERITGDLDDPDTGILFVLPIRKAWGLHRRREEQL